MFGPYSGGKYLFKCHVIASYFLSLLQNAAHLAHEDFVMSE
jgi:hypothetical protein